MSINVTVSGNPVRINRGKMVTSYDPEKREFEKRRLMRLQQVRHQSKDIAETVRNKLKKGQAKCLSDVEKEGEVKLRNWQARKLLELQDQYQDALGELGLGHKQAAVVEDEEESAVEQKESNEKVVQERGRAAAERLQIRKNEENLRKAVPVQRKKIARDAENVRASAVVSLQKGKNSRGVGYKNKNKQDVFDSDSENRVPQLTGLDIDSNGSDLQESHRLNKDAGDFLKTSKEQQTSVTAFKAPTTDKAAQTTYPTEDRVLGPDKQILFDTRISERIKRRTTLNPELDYCDYSESQSIPKHSTCACCHCCKCQTKPQVENIPEKNPETNEPNVNASIGKNASDDTNKGLGIENKEKTKSDVRVGGSFDEGVRYEATKPKSKAEITSKPKITLRPQQPSNVGESQMKPKQPVQYYNHPNRHSKLYVPQTSHVEKIGDENIDVSPNPLTDEELVEKMRQRDIEAQIRGQVALEKEKLQKEYRELLRKLPVLQKQERICEIGMDKEKYHMSQERLEEMEKSRQNRLDNAYEELFVRPKPAAVTLPKRQTIDEGRSVNLANWDVDFDPNHKNRSELLSEMLSDLKSHKSQLLKEIESTLTKEASGEFSKRKFDDVKSKSTDYSRVKSRRKRSRDERQSTSNVDEQTTNKVKSSRPTTSSPSPRKKAKLKTSKRKVLVLQNTSTQTTPKPGQSAATSPLVNSPASTASEAKVAESCPCQKESSLDDLCEIVIKIKEDEKPEVVVNPSSGKSVKVVTGGDEPDRHKVEKKKDESPRSGASWREQLSHTGASLSTTSTSYKDAPKSVRKKSIADDASRILNTTESSAGQPLDPRLLTYIKKLLSMSRASIDDLSVSSASDITTPSPSVVETPNNVPMSQLQTLIKYLKINPAQLQKELSPATTNASEKHYNTSESAISATSSAHSIVKQSDEEATTKLQHYADIAASCTKKISTLTEKIEKVRAEKRKIMQSSTSSDDNELTTTSYMQLPNNEEKSNKTNNSSADEEKLDQIDYGYAEKLKQLSDAEFEREARNSKQVVVVSPQHKISDGVESKTQTERAEISPRVDEAKTTQPTSIKAPALFLDIPKLPRLEASSLEKKKRPPPSKGLRTIPGNVATVPHELSTIIEADSQVSTKLDSPTKTVKSKSVESASKSSDDVSEMETMETMLISIGMDWAIPTLKKTREALAMTSSSGSGSKESGELSLKEFLSRISSTSSSLSDSQGMSLIDVDNRKTSTPLPNQKERKGPLFNDSDISSVKEHSDVAKESSEKFYDLNEGSLSKTG